MPGSPAASPERAAPAGFSPRRLGRFLREHLAYLLLFPLVVEWGTLVHELAHVAAVLVQGGTVTGFSVLPDFAPDGSFRFGHITWIGGDLEGRWLVELAPGVASTLLAAAWWLAGRRARPRAAWRLALLFLFYLPLVDVSMSFAGLFRGGPGFDYHDALAGHEPAAAVFAVVYFGLLGVAGWPLFGRAWPAALSRAEYAVGYAALLAAPWARFV